MCNIYLLLDKFSQNSLGTIRTMNPRNTASRRIFDREEMHVERETLPWRTCRSLNRVILAGSLTVPRAVTVRVGATTIHGDRKYAATIRTLESLELD